ncbi:MAG: WYL domain-containing protein [Anaerolineae bacterium]|nr:WYL domain-containing protein [Anaerolineae bacterium]
MLRAIHEDASTNGESLSAPAANKRLENDRLRLREHFGCDLEYDPSRRTFQLHNVEQSLIDLSPTAMRGLAFLQTNFAQEGLPMRDEVNALLQTLLLLMSPERKRELSHQRGIIELELGGRDNDEIDEKVWETVKRACDSNRELEFEYRSPQQDDEQPRVHHVEPYRYYFDASRKHYYLEAYRLRVSGPKGVYSVGSWVPPYRMGRISNPRVLPQVFDPNRRSRPRREIIYELTPQVARLGVTEHFPNSRITRFEDGHVEVQAFSHNLFLDLRALLHYGDQCKVIGGEEALAEMKALVVRMKVQYWE